MRKENQQGNKPPVREGDEIDVSIQSIGEKGDGVAKIDGFVLFVPDVKAGESVRVKLNKVLEKVGFAEVIGRNEKPKAEDTKPEKAEKAKSEEDELMEKIDESKFSEDFGEDDK